MSIRLKIAESDSPSEKSVATNGNENLVIGGQRTRKNHFSAPQAPAAAAAEELAGRELLVPGLLPTDARTMASHHLHITALCVPSSLPRSTIVVSTTATSAAASKMLLLRCPDCLQRRSMRIKTALAIFAFRSARRRKGRSGAQVRRGGGLSLIERPPPSSVLLAARARAALSQFWRLPHRNSKLYRDTLVRVLHPTPRALPFSHCSC